MPHDPTKVVMGTTMSSDRPGTQNFDADPATFLAGLACRYGTAEGSLTLAKTTTNQWAGVSLGRSLSDVKRTTVLPIGSAVPMLMSLPRAYSSATITSFANLVATTPDTLSINGTAFTAQAGAATPGTATFQAATSNNATATSLAAQINAHASIGLVVRAVAVGAVVTITAVSGGTAGNAITIVYTDNASPSVGLTLANATGGHLNSGSATASDPVVGSSVYIDDASGMATTFGGGATLSNAVYVSAALTGITEAGGTAPACLVDMIGGL